MDSSILSVEALNGFVEGMLVAIGREIQSRSGIPQIANSTVSCITSLSVFRPLIGMNKESIITRAKEIGTYEVSIEPQPDCCSIFMPKNPVTRGKIRFLEMDEEKIPWKKLRDDALSRMEVIKVDDLSNG